MKTDSLIKASTLILLILATSASAIELYDKVCNDDGSLKLVLKANDKSKVYTQDVEVRVGQTAMPGTWDINFITQSSSSVREYATYQSKGNILTAERSYPINVLYKAIQQDGSTKEESMPFEVECPGLLFSCENLNITMESCETQSSGLFRAVILIGGLEQSQKAKMDVMQVVDFAMEAENKYVDTTGKETSRGTLPQKAQVLRTEKDKYVVRYEFSSKKNNTVKTLWAGYNNNLKYNCQQDKYPEVKFYDRIECQKEEEQQTEEEKESEETTPVNEEPSPEEKKKTSEEILAGQHKNYKPLAIVSIILVAVLGVGGIVLSYLYKRGYM